LPAGTARIGNYEYNVSINASPYSVEEFNSIPIKVVGTEPVTIGDVGKVSDSFADQENVVRIMGKRASYLNILKKSNASTLDVVSSVKDILPSIKEIAPKGMDIKLNFDQSVFVRSAVTSVLREGAIATLLVSLLVLLFLGSWRSTLVICTSIPLAIFTAIIGLKLTGNTINIMTLGGLSLAIGMLVDDATVEVENIHRNRDLGRPLTNAILTSAHQVALPAIMATLAICIVFFPVSLLTGPARFLFTPMALAVVFSMLASYLLSRTLVPQLSRTLMASAPTHHETFFTHLFDRFQKRYDDALSLFLKHRGFILWVALVFFIITSSLAFFIGRDFFPTTDTGLMKLHFRAPAGLRIEKTEEMVEQVENRIRAIIPADELETINSQIGVPTTYNLAFVPTDNMGTMDVEFLIDLKPSHAATSKYMQLIRADLARNFPESTIEFQSADIVSQVLNFGLSAPIDIQFEGQDVGKSYVLAKKLQEQLRLVPGLVDVNIKQVFDMPNLALNVDRIRAAELGLTQENISNALLVALSSSFAISPSFYLNPKNLVNYTVAVKVPLLNITTVEELLSTTVTPSSGVTLPNAQQNPTTVPSALSQRLGNVATLDTTTIVNGVNHLNVQRLINMSANVEGRDWVLQSQRSKRRLIILASCLQEHVLRFADKMRS
jgi:multidrug efflux pump subunit AcrB